MIVAALLSMAALSASPDLNGDGQVDGLDLGILHGAWGEATPGNGVADLDGDGAIDGADLGVLLGAWGPLAPATIAVRSDWGVAGTVYDIPAADHDADPSPIGPGWTRYAWGWTTTPYGHRERAFAVHMRGERE